MYKTLMGIMGQAVTLSLDQHIKQYHHPPSINKRQDHWDPILSPPWIHPCEWLSR